MVGEVGRPTVSAARPAATIPSVSDLGRRKTAPLTASALRRHFLFKKTLRYEIFNERILVNKTSGLWTVEA
jgi:hypothetical protein